VDCCWRNRGRKQCGKDYASEEEGLQQVPCVLFLAVDLAVAWDLKGILVGGKKTGGAAAFLCCVLKQAKGSC